jgi:glycerol-3-phosphate dehydrogenase (NAD(P)+)
VATFTILGAGAMGSALATPLRARGQEVRLWGTWLDGHLLDAIEAGRPHPRTGVPVPEGVSLFRAEALQDALRDADVAVLAVSSPGVHEVISRAASSLASIDVLAVTSKGLLKDGRGRVQILPAYIADLFTGLGFRCPALVAVGGPCKANEVAAGRATATVYGSADLEAARRVGRLIQTDAYRIEATSDYRGLEIAAPLKNAYAIALGYTDGVMTTSPVPWHDLKSAVFAQAVREMAELAVAVGGSAATAYGLAGTGDLQVTGLSGRNRAYGERLGAGEGAREALDAMTAAEQTVEGVPAAELARDLVDQRDASAWDDLPLLRAVLAILDDDPDPVGRVAEAVLP